MTRVTFAALGIAGNVVQFVDFGTKLCSRISEFCAPGTPETLLAQATCLSDLLEILKGLPEARHLGLDQQVICVCIRQVEHLLALLDLLTSGHGSGISKWRAPAKAFRSLRSEKEMLEVQSTLDSLLANLSLQLLARMAGVCFVLFTCEA